MSICAILLAEVVCFPKLSAGVRLRTLHCIGRNRVTPQSFSQPLNGTDPHRTRSGFPNAFPLILPNLGFPRAFGSQVLLRKVHPCKIRIRKFPDIFHIFLAGKRRMVVSNFLHQVAAKFGETYTAYSFSSSSRGAEFQL